MMNIRTYEDRDKDQVGQLIVPIQSREFGIAIRLEDQPDLCAIPDFYQHGCGNFWVAEVDGEIVGSIALLDIGHQQAALRKMFVAQNFRGREHGVAAKLLDSLLVSARNVGVREIFLGTTDKFLAAHRFYEKNGFVEIDRTQLPVAFPVMAIDSKFYRYMF